MVVSQLVETVEYRENKNIEVNVHTSKKFDKLNLVVEPRIEFTKKFRRETIMTMMAANILLVLKDNA